MRRSGQHVHRLGSLGFLHSKYRSQMNNTSLASSKLTGPTMSAYVTCASRSQVPYKDSYGTYHMCV